MVSSYETDIRLPSYEVMVRLADLFGVTVDYLLCRQDKRFLDISDLSEEEAALVCGHGGAAERKKTERSRRDAFAVSVSFCCHQSSCRRPPVAISGENRYNGGEK